MPRPVSVAARSASGPTLKRSAQRMGEGVTFVSATPMKAEDGFEGSKAIFAFAAVAAVQKRD